MGPDLWELFEDGNGDDEVAAIIRLGHYAVLPKNVRVVTQFSEIITIRTTRANLPNVSGAAEVADIAAGDTYLGPDLEFEPAGIAEISSDTVLSTDERRPSDIKATGRGVVVGLVDWGFDFAHPDFLNKDGTTRILALWDQRGSKLPNSPVPFGYGVVHNRDEINRALKQQDPYAALGYHPADADTGFGCHGTHVLSIAAGGGGEDRPMGIAPEADLILVHNAPWDELDTGRLGDSVTLLEGIDFIARTAGDRPWVINLSMGRHGEQHDGTTLIEQGLDAAIRLAPGRAICLSTGNYFDKRIHASGQLRPTQERTIVWDIVEGKPTNNQLEFWYSWQDRFEVTVRSPEGSIMARAKIGDRSKFVVGGKEVGNVYHRGQEPNNLDNHITIYLYEGAPTGEWEVTLTGSDVIDGRYHAWIERDVSCPACQSRLRADDADPKSTTGTICNGRRTLAVGAYNKHDPEMRLGHFSSVGPTRDGRLKPDLCAPGVSVLAARSAPREKQEPPQLLTRMSGTSMAAPHVTGTVALMFQAAPRRLRIEETHNLLLQSARKVSIPEDIPERIGIGFLDIDTAVESAAKVGSPTSTFKQTTVQSKAEPSANPARQEGEAESIESPGPGAGEIVFEGRSDPELDLLEGGYQNTFHRIASDITSAFEGGKTGTLNLYDLGIITYGKHQATLHSGTLYPILKRFTELSSTETSTKMASYLQRVKDKDETLRDESDFIQLLKDAAKEPEMDQAQDEEFAKQYWQPAKKKAADDNIKTALGHAIYYDIKVQGGLPHISEVTKKSLGGTTGQTVDNKEIAEADWLKEFVNQRIQWNLALSTAQKKKAEELKNAAQDLEKQADGAADPAQADALKKQAAQKRKKAGQFAANGAALEVSSKKTRGPSWTALVDAGDLNLYDGDAKKIYLKGKPGVAIEALTAGATIDETTPAAAPAATPAAAPAAPAPAAPPVTAPTAESFGTSIYPTSTKRKYVDIQTEYVPAPAEARGAGPGRFQFVELADEVVQQSQGRQDSTRLLHELFERNDEVEALARTQRGDLPSAAEIYDSFVYTNNSWMGERLGGNFEVVALPLEPLGGRVRAGDLMIRRAEGEYAHVAMVASEGSTNLDETLGRGLRPESHTPGEYVQVVEGGARPHQSSDKYARQLTDSAGRLLSDILLLRLAEPPAPVVVTVQQPAKTTDPDAGEAIPAEDEAATLASASREMSLRGIADGNLGQLPKDILEAILVRGETDASALADQVFWQKHPDLKGTRLDAKDPSRRDLRAEWSVIFRRRVTPIIWLRAMICVLDQYRGTLPRDFLLGWIAWESDGDLQSTTPLGELGYFQIMWQGGEAQTQLHISQEEFQKLKTDPDFSIQKGVALAEAYRRYILRTYPAVADGSDLLWRLTKARHAASGILKAAMAKLTDSRAPLTWDSVSGVMPGWMAENIRNTMSYAGKLKVFADLVPVQDRPVGESEVAEAGEALGPLLDTFGAFECCDHEQWADIKLFADGLNSSGIFEEIEISDSSQIPPLMQADIAAAGWFHKLGTAPTAGYELKWKGRIYYPRGASAGSLAGTRAFPVVILLHGNHDWFDSTGKEIDNHLGYEYLQQELAKHGIVSVSIGTNIANRTGSRVRTRAEFVLAGLRILSNLNSSAGRFYRRLDLKNVGMMGHSRGGDAIVKAALLTRGSSDCVIRAVCSLAPTDLTGTSSNPLVLRTDDRVRYLVLYGSHDGDVGGQSTSTGTGFRHYDRATCQRTMAFVKGAKHDRFNTNWGTADPADCSPTDPDFLSPSDHQQLAIDYVAGLFRLELNGDTTLKGLFDGSSAPSGSHTISFQWSSTLEPRNITTILHGTPLDPSVKWTKGWTTLMPLKLPGTDAAFELAYKKDTGEVSIDRIDPRNGADTIWSDGWRKGWTNFITFLMPGDDRVHDLGYMAHSGEAGIDRIARDGKSVEVNIWKDTWSKGWTSFMPVRLPGDDQPYYLAYKKEAGDVTLDRIKPIGQGVESIFRAKWSKGWTSFMAFRLPGDDRQFYLAYKKDSGDVVIDRIDADGKNISIIWRDSWSKGWTSFVPFRMPGDDRAYFLAYKEGDGSVSVDRIRRDGQGTETILKDAWPRQWSHFVNFESGGKSNFLAYKVDQGDVMIGNLLPDQMLEVENFEDRSSGPYDPTRDLLNAPSSSSALSRVNFDRKVFPARPLAIPHQTHVLSGSAAGAKYRAEIPPENRVFTGFDLMTFRLTSDFKLDSPADISAGQFPQFKVRVFYGNPAGAGTGSAVATQADIDTTGVRQRQRPFFRQIDGGGCVNGTKIVLQTIAIPLAKFVGVNWNDVRAIEFEAGPAVSAAFFFDSLALMQS